MEQYGIGGPSYTLTWAREAFRTELRWVLSHSTSSRVEARWLLEEAFSDPEPASTLDILSTNDEWTAPDEAHLGFLRTLLSQLDELPERLEPRPYWAQRQRRVPESSALSPEQRLDRLKAAWVREVHNFRERGYLDNAVPSPCVDARLDDHQLLSDRLDQMLDVPNLWPLQPDAWDEDLFYSLIEAIGDLIARPRHRTYHDYADCGWHYSRFAAQPGQALYRTRINSLLNRWSFDLRLAEDGEDVGRLVRIVGDDRDALVSTVLATPSATDQNTVAHAVAMFRDRDADRAAKVSAIVALARILEDRRPLLRDKLHARDEGALFEIANRYDLRHSNPQQLRDYGEEFLDWVFWWYLATVELSDRLMARDRT
ncbi:hypothetical protein NUM3379_34910 [Kineococcus sp. NUM-3379]